MTGTETISILSRLPNNDLMALLKPAFGGENFNITRDVSVTHLKDGYNSSGSKLQIFTTDSRTISLFAKEPKITNSRNLHDVLKDTLIETNKDIPNLPKTHTIIGRAGSELGTIQVGMSLSGIDAILIIQELINIEKYFPLVDIMHGFGISTIQTATNTNEYPWATTTWLSSVYKEIIQEMVQTHSAKPNKSITIHHHEAGLNHIIKSHERLNGIASLVGNENPIITQEKITKLRNQMYQLIDLHAHSNLIRSTLSHGDNWMANRFANEQGHTIPIDPAPILIADPAYDLVFALSDLVFTQMQSNKDGSFSGPFTELAETLLIDYEDKSGDKDIRHYMPLYFGYKAFVAAVFDAKDERQKENLLSTALKITESGRSPNFEFSFSRLDSLAD